MAGGAAIQTEKSRRRRTLIPDSCLLISLGESTSAISASSPSAAASATTNAGLHADV
jgi:hypothetical protein